MNDLKRKTVSKQSRVLNDVKDVALVAVIFIIIAGLFKLIVWLFQLIFN